MSCVCMKALQFGPTSDDATMAETIYCMLVRFSFLTKTEQSIRRNDCFKSQRFAVVIDAGLRSSGAVESWV